MTNDWPDWISAAAAVLTVAGAVIAWWRSNISRTARTAAKESEERAKAHLEAAERAVGATERVAAEVRELVRTLEPPMLEMHRSGPNEWQIVNNRDHAIEISELLNRNEFDHIEDLVVPVRINPRSRIGFIALRPPHELHVRLGDGTESHLGIPRA